LTAQHVVPRKIYFAVFTALIVLTATTTAVSFIDLGPWNTVVALGIAFLKATLVVLFFMHVKYSPRLTQVTIAGGLFWLAIMIVLTLSDFMTRGWLPTLQQLRPR
jgi:cytochrome c oxidase subunit 4